jgi:PadR family transcriptional regulator PadR
VNVARRLPLLKGTLDLLILKALSCEPSHGYGLATWLERHSDGRLLAEDSALYQALHRMEARGLIQAEWGVTENNRRARYYRLTSHGRAHLEEEAATWRRYAASVAAVLDVEPRPDGGPAS